MLPIILFLSIHLVSTTRVKVGCDCIQVQRCKAWTSAVNSGKYLDLPVCGFQSDSLNPLLCCPHEDAVWKSGRRRTIRGVQNNFQGLENIQLSCKIASTQASSPVQKAKQQCEEYGKLIFQSLFEVSVGDEPFKKEKVDTCVKGSDVRGAKSREFPHMALIGFGDEQTWNCGGSLISERFILSTAHCADSRLHGPARWAKLGELDLSTDTDIARPRTYKINERIVHPEYVMKLKYNDIALLKLETDIDFTIYVRPACLYTRRDPPDNFADATGWGQSAFASGSPSTYLKKIKMELVSKDDCFKSYNSSSDSRALPRGIDHDTMICAKETNVGGPAVCQGDSGGPLQVALKKPYCMYGLIGLTAFGKGCGMNFPGVNIRVSFYIPWIVENVWPDDE